MSDSPLPLGVNDEPDSVDHDTQPHQPKHRREGVPIDADLEPAALEEEPGTANRA